MSERSAFGSAREGNIRIKRFPRQEEWPGEEPPLVAVAILSFKSLIQYTV
jgi:hypothetical protein